MDNGYFRQRDRPTKGGLAADDTRNGPPPSMFSPAISSPMTRAERFEDEKKRIIESCFYKQDANGAVTESYITHIKIEEDAAYPQTPPPADSPPENKKPRVIIVAVRNTGRVRMHKGRENANGTFSVGKTWNMDDFSAVESFTHGTPQTREERQWKQDAGDTGFIVTIIKPYYWKAGTAKEKEFFIASLVKIYRKYTQGKIPHLVGFSRAENDTMLGAPGPPLSNATPTEQAPGPLPQSRSRPPPSQERLPPGPDPRSRRPPVTDSFRGSPRPTPNSSRSDLGQLPGTPQSSSVSSMGPTGAPPQLSPKRQGVYGLQNADVRRAQASSEGLGFEDSMESLSGSTYDRNRPNGGFPPDNRAQSPRLRPPTAQSSHSSAQQDSADEKPRRPSPKRKPLSSEFNQSEFQRRISNQSVEKISSETSTVKGEDNSLRGSRAGSQSRPSMPGGFFSPLVSSDSVPREASASRPPVVTNDSKSSLANDSSVSVPLPATSPDPVTSPSNSTAMSPSEDSESFRPGLGPMIRKKGTGEAAARFRNVAKAATAFRPRVGGAAEKLLQLKKQEASGQSDGISGVFPAQPVRANSSQSATSVQSPDSTTQKPTLPILPTAVTSSSDLPSVTVSSPTGQDPPSFKEKSVRRTSLRDSQKAQAKEAPEKRQSLSAVPSEKDAIKEAKRRRRRSNRHAKYLSALGVDPTAIEGLGLEFESTLLDFGWGNKTTNRKKIEDLEADVRRELGRVEAGSWLGHLEQKDDRVELVESLLDRAIAECDELEGLLTLYGVELSSLNEDIAFIEAQSQGLQVQTANQKLLQTELNNLVDTISITSTQLAPLRQGSIGKPEGLQAIEQSLLLLYKAMITIDPNLRHSGRDGKPNQDATGNSKYGESELSQMRALREKRDSYLEETIHFLDRLRQFMDMTFGAAALTLKDASTRQTDGSSPTKLDRAAHDISRKQLWQFSPLLLFSKEIDIISWENLIKVYQARFMPRYKEEIQNNMMAWQKKVKSSVSDDAELLFTAQEKEPEGLSSAARKLTVKRSQTLAKTLRSAASGDKQSPADRSRQTGRMHAFEAFAGGLDEVTPIIFAEQNFIVDFFHATSNDNVDFADAVTLDLPEMRRGTDVNMRKLFEPDRAMARRVIQVMEDMFGFWAEDLEKLVERAVQEDPLQVVGIIGAVSRTLASLEETNQDFLNRSLQKVHDRLAGQFVRFIDEQVRAIEDTKVKVKKRKGVIGLIRIFPNFSSAIENMLPSHEALNSPLSPGTAAMSDQLSVRHMVDEAYTRVNKAMFESLKVIAKESPTTVGAGAGGGAQTGDPEDKEALNYHILFIENMHHYLEEVDGRAGAVLAWWRDEAEREMMEHLGLYVDAIIRRPIGKLLDFVESTETQLLNVSAASSLTTRPSHSRSTAKKLLSSIDAKEMRRGVDALKKRVDKHFSDIAGDHADSMATTSSTASGAKLVANVLAACEGKYKDAHERLRKVLEVVYSAEPLEIDWNPQDITAAFRNTR